MVDATTASNRVRPGAKDELRGAAELFRSVMGITMDDGSGSQAVVPLVVASAQKAATSPPEPELVPSSPEAPSVPPASKPKLPAAARVTKTSPSQRTDSSLIRGTYYFRRDQIIDLKRIRLQVLERTGEEVDLSALVREAIDLLLKKHRSLVDHTGDAAATIEGSPPANT